MFVMNAGYLGEQYENKKGVCVMMNTINNIWTQMAYMWWGWEWHMVCDEASL